jgi:hypothetical protein
MAAHPATEEDCPVDVLAEAAGKDDNLFDKK